MIALNLAKCIGQLEAVRAHAEAHPFDLAALRRRLEGTGGQLDPAMRCELPGGLLVSFSVEQHPAGWMRHLSVSVRGLDGAPGLKPVATLGRLLGLRLEPGEFGPTVIMYLEVPSDGGPIALNLVEPLGAVGSFACALCGGTFPILPGDDDAAQAEARALGIEARPECIVCDVCYPRTPYAAEPGLN